MLACLSPCLILTKKFVAMWVYWKLFCCFWPIMAHDFAHKVLSTLFFPVNFTWLFEENKCDVTYTWRLSFTFLLHSRSLGIPKFFLKLAVRPFQKIGAKKIRLLRNWCIYLLKYVWHKVWWSNYEFSISYAFIRISSNLKRGRQWRMGIPYCHYNEASVKDL